MRLFKKPVLILLIILTHLVFSYYFFNGWWCSGIGSVLMILLSYFLWKGKCLEQIGLKLTKRSFLFSIVMAGTVLLFSYYFLNHIAHNNGATILFTQWGYYIHDVFYSLNEEMLLGAMLLFYLIKRYKIHPLAISSLVALVFAMIHFIFYKWIFAEKGVIQPITLLTLFFIGFLRNNLIVIYKHIGFSWALHFGWVAIMLGSHHVFTANGVELGEPERFNLYLGSNKMLFISLLLALSSLFLYKHKRTI